MDDIDDTAAAEQAFVAYFTTVTGRPAGEVTFEGLRDGRIIAGALNHEESEHFAPALNESELSDPGARQRYLKRIYHDLLTCPSCSLAAYLPTPDIPSIIDPSPSSRSSWQAELLSLCKVVLLVQAVWSKKNAGVIGVITELEVDDQSVLKEIIESALSSMVLPQESDDADEADVQSEMLYNLQAQRRKTLSDREELVKQVEQLQARVEEQAAVATRPKITLGTPNRARLGVNGSRTSTPARRIESPTASDEDDEPVASSSTPDLPITPLRKKALAGKSTDTPASPMERMKNLEIERLKQESNERADEVARLEEVVEQGKKTITQHAQRIMTLEQETREMEALRDELEVRKHASENLKKSEATVEKMRKRLEESSDLKDRIESLEMQKKELIETNTLLEDKYKDLSRSKGVKEDPAASAVNTETLNGSLPESAGLAKNKVEDQLRRHLRQREDEIEELRRRVEELENDMQTPAQGGTLGDVEGLKEDTATSDIDSKARIAELEAQLSTTSLSRAGSGGIDHDFTDEQVMRLLEVKEQNVLLKEQVKALDQKLVAAKELLKEQEELHKQAGSSSVVPADGKRIQELEKTIDRLKQQQSEADERFHLERIIALKSWKDLGRRAPRPTRDRNT